jgi:hypothetical protein
MQPMSCERSYQFHLRHAKPFELKQLMLYEEIFQRTKPAVMSAMPKIKINIEWNKIL